jgi:hypothetical protein
VTPIGEHPAPLTFYAIDGPWPGPAWQDLFHVSWPAYRSWYLGVGAVDRPDLNTARTILGAHMPELVPSGIGWSS